MFVVLEGCDGAGKTTLAERLADRARARDLKAEVWHRGVPVRHPLEEYELDIETDYPQDPDARLSTLIVADRWHLGQLVYGGLYRDANDLGDGGAWHVDRLLETIGAAQFIISPPLEIIRQRLGVRGEDYLKAEHVQHVWEHYERLARDRPVTLVNRVDIPDNALDVVIDSLVSETESTNQLIRFMTYVGPRFPKILLLGERHGDGPMADSLPRHRAAFVPYAGTSGRWLAETLAACLPQSSIGLANAGQENLSQLVRMLNYPQVVALGREAARYCELTNIEHGTVPHPQFMRRFHVMHTHDYANAIVQAATSQEEVMQPWL